MSRRSWTRLRSARSLRQVGRAVSLRFIRQFRSPLRVAERWPERLEELRQAVQDGGTFRSADLIQRWVSGPVPPYLFGDDNRDALTARFTEQPAYILGLRTRAERICRGEVHLFGRDINVRTISRAGEVNKIPWHTDVFSGYTWTTAKVTPVGGPVEPGVEIRVPWELSRFHHFAVLGQAYWLLSSSDNVADRELANDCVAEFSRQSTDWIERNPVGIGVNWACTMDVAIRAVNWTHAFHYFRHASVPQDFWPKFLWSVLQHGRFIWRNQENAHLIANNHYLSNLVGLLFIARGFPKLLEARQWRDWAVRELVRESNLQFDSDGVNFEASLNYHRYAVELLLSTIALCRASEVTLPASFHDRAVRMVEFVLNYTKPDGRAPMIGDSDESRLQMLSGYGEWDPGDHRYILGIGGLLFDRDDFVRAAGNQLHEGTWLCKAARN